MADEPLTDPFNRLLDCDLHLLAIHLVIRRWLREELTDDEAAHTIREQLNERESSNGN